MVSLSFPFFFFFFKKKNEKQDVKTIIFTDISSSSNELPVLQFLYSEFWNR